MGKSFWYLIMLFALSAFILAACSGSAQGFTVSSDAQPTEGEGASMEVEEGEDEPGVHIPGELPADYEGLENPFINDPAAIAAGADIFDASCAKCHGESGKGDGPVAAGLDLKPASFTDAALMDTLSDAYLFWRISEGGAKEPFNSSMPASSYFSEEQRWQLVSFVRSLSK